MNPSSAFGPANLNPSLTDLLALTFNPLVWLPVVLLAGVYLWQCWRAWQTLDGRRNWPLWKPVFFLLGTAALLWATQSVAASYTLNSMALYMVRLMVLAELVPPLLVLSLPRHLQIAPRSGLGRVLGVLTDPWVAFAVWTAVIVFWNVPAGFNASVVTNTAAIMLPALYLISGLMIWAAMLTPFPTVQPPGAGKRGWYGLLASLPMMSIAAWWLYAPRVLYSPYVGALCLWNLSALQNQQISGWIMMLAGLPALGVAVWKLLLWLVEVSEGPGGGSAQASG